MSEINGHDGMSQQDLDDLALLGVNDEDTLGEILDQATSKVAIGRVVTTSIAGFCVGTTVNKLIKQNVQTTGKFSKIQVGIGVFVIGSVVGYHCERYVAQRYDEIVGQLVELFTEEV
jgi:hypothetical protein